MIRTRNYNDKLGSLLGRCASNKTSDLLYRNRVVQVNFGCMKAPRCGVVISWRIFVNFRENRNAQGQAVCEFSGPADRVYCSQTFVFAKTAVLPIRAPRNLYPAYIVNIGQVGS